MKPYKATCSSTVPNYVFTHARELLVPHLGPLYCATHNLKYYPDDWALTETLMLKKPGRPDYSVPSAWRPIVLSCGMACLLNCCHTEDITVMCEKLNILPANHFGARPGRTTTDSIHLLIKIIKDAWRKQKVASVLFLDVKGAFLSVAVDRLIHNMRSQGIPEQYTEWMKRQLGSQQTTLLFDNHCSEKFSIDNGLDQGDPFSGICYLIYNANLLDIPRLHLGEWILLFIDDAAVIVVGRDFRETHAALPAIMTRLGGLFEWATDHNCEFGLDKFQLVDATRQCIPHTFIH